MNCFEHSQRPAVGTCAYCGRGVCADCMAVVEGKLSCRGKCESEIARERRLLEHSERAISERSVVYETSGGIYHRSFAVSAFFGIGFLALGLLLMLSDHLVFGAILSGLGVVFLVNGIGLARASKKFKTMAEQGRQKAEPDEHSH